EMRAERDLTGRLGVDFVNLPMPGDGLGEEWQFREILKVLDDPERRPALVHCARGTCRTGAAVAFYRFQRDGWTPEDVASELRRQTYHYGLVPGYIYAMVRTKPSSQLQAETVVDRNREPGVRRKEADDER
ncbi:MAG TPA: protein tyrosine phosphatase, partial [Isosphaeraceae bacterium]|nr:protein tyrosine phosphatase [Isosphaeraceae bacterium]